MLDGAKVQLCDALSPFREVDGGEDAQRLLRLLVRLAQLVSRFGGGSRLFVREASE